MLRITELATGDGGRALRLDGKLLGPWVPELRRACLRNGDRAPAAHLDLSALSFVDDDGLVALRELAEQGVVLAPCSPYVAALLRVG